MNREAKEIVEDFDGGKVEKFILSNV